MKIAVFVDISYSAGGGLQQTLGVLNILNKIKSENYSLHFCSSSPDISKFIHSKGIQNTLFNKKNFLNRIQLKIFKTKFISKVLNSINIINPFENFLKKNNFNLVFFVDQSSLALYCDKTNFIFNVWQLDHRKLSFFPEYDLNTYLKTEKLYKFVAHRAYKILIDCNKSKREFSHFYNCPINKIGIQPLLPNLVMSKPMENIKLHNEQILDLNLNKTFFYPAQFWAHKNHVYLLDAMNCLIQNGVSDYKLIFTGRDRGNLKFIKNKIKILNLDKNIIIIENLKDQEIIYLYMNCLSLILPTFVGSTSLPLFEAFHFKSNIIYNSEILDDDLKRKVIPLNVNDPKNLFEIVKEFQKNKNFNFEKKEDAKKYIDEVLDEKKLIDNFEKIFQEFFYYFSRSN